ncbi:ATP-binding protein [Desulfococcaceae bacterium HSG8]|nr:ATP-binding protein [Desulfococcaceae bacterium HSG8]
MDNKNRETEKLKRRVAGLEKTLQIVSRHSGRVEKNLRQLFEAVSDTMPVPMMIALQTGKILFSNEKAREIFGFSGEDFYKINTSELYETPGDRDTFLKAIAERGGIRDFSARLKKADGKIFPASLFSQQIIFEGQDCFLTVIYDLSEIRKEEEKRLAIERQLRQTQKMEAIGTMAGGIAHDFNNILSIISGRVQLAMMKIPEESRGREDLDDAMTAAKRGKSIIMQILDFCRQREQELKLFHISKIVREAVTMIRSMTSSTIRIDVRIESESSVIRGDPTHIHQILMNLCSNANYALRGKGGVIEIRVEEISSDSQEETRIPDLRPGLYARLTVSDSGPGIDKKVIERVFDPFFTTKPSGEGTGMGLAAVHGIVQSHGGTVIAESEPGKGTAFHCYFPLATEIV